jgi:hypothetical protein
VRAKPPGFGEAEVAPAGGPASVEADTGLLVPAIAEPEAQPDTATATSGTENDWLCAWCHNRVANENDRFSYDGKSEFTFSNPEGIRFAIITFSRTLGCQETGTPTLEHTWFPGYAWSFCLCDNCGQHLGWYYSSKIEFAGLIIARIVRALCVRN